MVGCGSDLRIRIYRCNDCESQIIQDAVLEVERMLNDEVQAWIDLGFPHEEAIAMANMMNAVNDDVKITDDDPITSFTDSSKKNMSQSDI